MFPVFQFIDVNNDGFSDLIVGAPLRSEDATEEFYDGKLLFVLSLLFVVSTVNYYLFEEYYLL